MANLFLSELSTCETGSNLEPKGSGPILVGIVRAMDLSHTETSPPHTIAEKIGSKGTHTNLQKLTRA